MDGTRQDRALTDTQLDREIEFALGVDPSPDFLARVRARVEAEPPVRRWQKTFRGVVASAAAFDPVWIVGIAGIVLATVIPAWIRDDTSPVPVTGSRTFASPPVSEQPGNGEAPTHPPQAHSGATGGGQRRPMPRMQKRLQGTAEVLVSEKERQAFDALLAAAAENRLPLRAAPLEAPGGSLAIAPLQIQQLSIEPVLVAGLEGEKKS